MQTNSELFLNGDFLKGAFFPHVPFKALLTLNRTSTTFRRRVHEAIFDNDWKESRLYLEKWLRFHILNQSLFSLIGMELSQLSIKSRDDDSSALSVLLLMLQLLLSRSFNVNLINKLRLLSFYDNAEHEVIRCMMSMLLLPIERVFLADSWKRSGTSSLFAKILALEPHWKEDVGGHQLISYPNNSDLGFSLSKLKSLLKLPLVLSPFPKFLLLPKETLIVELITSRSAWADLIITWSELLFMSIKLIRHFTPTERLLLIQKLVSEIGLPHYSSDYDEDHKKERNLYVGMASLTPHLTNENEKQVLRKAYVKLIHSSEFDKHPYKYLILEGLYPLDPKFTQNIIMTIPSVQTIFQKKSDRLERSVRMELRNILPLLLNDEMITAWFHALINSLYREDVEFALYHMTHNKTVLRYASAQCQSALLDILLNRIVNLRLDYALVGLIINFICVLQFDEKKLTTLINHLCEQTKKTNTHAQCYGYVGLAFIKNKKRSETIPPIKIADALIELMKTNDNNIVLKNIAIRGLAWIINYLPEETKKVEILNIIEIHFNTMHLRDTYFVDAANHLLDTHIQCSQEMKPNLLRKLWRLKNSDLLPDSTKDKLIHYIAVTQSGVVNDLLNNEVELNPSYFGSIIGKREEIVSGVFSAVNMSRGNALFLMAALHDRDAERVKQLLSIHVTFDQAGTFLADPFFSVFNKLLDVLSLLPDSAKDIHMTFTSLFKDCRELRPHHYDLRPTLREAALSLLKNAINDITTVDQKLSLLKRARNEVIFNEFYTKSFFGFSKDTDAIIEIKEMAKRLRNAESSKVKNSIC